jgi:2-polyprenyl-3-methyl-5-hydroxy-6-metoxy-1,4-benzoquinol methylase
MNLGDYAKRTQFYTEDVPQLLSNYLDRVHWNSCLDLGCGDGSLLYALDKKGYLAGKTVYAVDMSESRLELVRHINEDIVCLRRDACETQIQDGSIDFLISTQLIEHVPNDTEMVKEIQRILSSNGTVYLSTVFKKWYGWYFYRCNGKWTLDPTHLREYTHDDQLLGIFRDHGFEVLENEKTLDGRPILDSIMRRIGAGRKVYNNRLLKMLRAVSIPIPGYYIWEIVCAKR